MDEFSSCFGAVDLFQVFMENNLEEVFSETVTLLKIIITTPMTTAEAERCFSTLKRIKTFLRNTMTQERLNALAMPVHGTGTCSWDDRLQSESHWEICCPEGKESKISVQIVLIVLFPPPFSAPSKILLLPAASNQNNKCTALKRTICNRSMQFWTQLLFCFTPNYSASQ